MNDIVTAAGVGPATLYRHFPTREALLEALVAEALQQLAAKIADAGLERVPVPEAIQWPLRAAPQATCLRGPARMHLVHQKAGSQRQPGRRPPRMADMSGYDGETAPLIGARTGHG